MFTKGNRNFIEELTNKGNPRKASLTNIKDVEFVISRAGNIYSMGNIAYNGVVAGLAPCYTIVPIRLLQTDGTIEHEPVYILSEDLKKFTRLIEV